MKNLKNFSILYTYLIFVSLISLFCNSAMADPGLSVGETIPNPEITTIGKYEYDRLIKDNRLHDYKEGQVLLIAFMPSVEDYVSYSKVMTNAFDTYFAEGLSFRSFRNYEYTNPELRVIVVTPDKAEVLKNFAVEKDLDFEFISDEKMDIAKLFGIANWSSDKNTNGSFVYVVNKDNKITFADYDYKGQGEKLKSVQTALYSAFDLQEGVALTKNFEPVVAGEKERDFAFKYVMPNQKEVILTPYELHEGKLSEYIGKKNVLIAFYPAAYSLSCSFEASSINHWAEDQMLEKVKNSRLNDNDLEILMVSVSNPYILSKWQSDLNLYNVKLVSDDNGEISQMYSSYSQFGYNKRTMFLIDKEGNVSYINWNYQVNDDDFELLKENVMALK